MPVVQFWDAWFCLGIDFWRAFEIAPDVLGITSNTETQPEASKVTMASTGVEYYRDEDVVVSDPEMWDLLQHRIQLIEGTEPVKDRHYPLSPAKQEIVWTEVDKMLELGIIEESDSPWSNRTTVVMKPVAMH